MMGIHEPFLGKYQARVRLLLKERPHGPVFLYSREVSEVKSWERAIRMSKYLLNAADREAMAYVIGRVAGSIMAKGWNAGFRPGFASILGPKRLLKALSAGISRSWKTPGGSSAAWPCGSRSWT